MAKAKPTSLVDDVLATAVKSRPGFGTWHSRLPPEARAELDAARAAFDPTRHQKRAYAKAIMDACQARGWQTSGIQGVLAWLDGRR